MPLHCNETASQKTPSLKSEEVFDPKTELKPEFEDTSLLQKVYITNGLPKELTELSRF